MIIFDTIDQWNKGIFSQGYGWLLYVLHIFINYLDKGINPNIVIRSGVYGDPKNKYNIIPSLLELNYIPNDNNGLKILEINEMTSINKDIIISLSKLCRDNLNTNQCSNFQKIHDDFFRIFKIPKNINTVVESFVDNLKHDIVLGVHYRGTDKNRHPEQTSHVSYDEFVTIINDFIISRKITCLFVATDEEPFLNYLKKSFSKIKIVYYKQYRTQGGIKNIHHHHKEEDNITLGMNAIIDALILSKCSYVLKNQSQLSAWAKIFNPNLEIYRISAIKVLWYPDVFIKLYKSDDTPVQKLLDKIQKNDISHNDNNKKN